MEDVSPTCSLENQDEEPRGPGKEDHGKRSPDLDLNQAVTRADDDDDGDDFPPQSAQEQWPEERNLDVDRALQQRHSPPSERFSRSPSPRQSPALSGKRSPSPANKLSVSPVHHPSIKLSPPARSMSPYEKKRSPPPTRRSPSPRRRQSPGKRRSRSRSPDGRYGQAAGADEGRKQYDRHGLSPRSPVRRSGRALSPRGRERHGRSRSRSRSPPGRDNYRRSRYSPRRRASPPRYRSKRDHSPRRRPWSPPANRSTGVGKPGNNLFVAGFSFVTTERDLEKKFSRYGRVTDVRIVRDKRSGDSRGFGFLSLERDEDADAAIRALDQTEWNGRIVLVEKDLHAMAESQWTSNESKARNFHLVNVQVMFLYIERVVQRSISEFCTLPLCT